MLTSVLNEVLSSDTIGILKGYNIEEIISLI